MNIILRRFFDDDCNKSGRAEFLSHIISLLYSTGTGVKQLKLVAEHQFQG